MAKCDFSPPASIQFNANNVLDRKCCVLDEYDNTYCGSPAGVSLSLRLMF